MSAIDNVYVGIPWKDGGRSMEGADCVGLALMWLREQMGFEAPAPKSNAGASAEEIGQAHFKPQWNRGDVVFFRHRPSGQIRHVAVCLGEWKLLHTLQGCSSRIDNGPILLKRLGFDPVGALPPADAESLCRALADPKLGWVELIIALVMLALSYAITAATAQSYKAKAGRYGPQALITQTNPEIPLPDLLGTVVVAGNSVYQTIADKNGVSTPANQKYNQVIVLASGPSELIDYSTGLQIKGVSWQDKSWFNGSNIDGIAINPTQDKANCVTGSINGDSNVPSITLYDGAYGIAVPVDVRAQYDRTFPIYGHSGCTYLVGRWMDSTKFGSFNLTCRVKCRKCRTFDTSGFVVTSVSSESLAGADGAKVRFKLAHEDIKAVTAVTVNASSYTEISASNQSGNIYSINKLKGYIEFITAPAVGATISVNYDYYPRAFTANPASHVVYLLTEPRRGKGFDDSRISWPEAVAFRDFCDDSITWVGASGTTTGARYETNYAIDDRKPIQDHLRALLDACNGLLFLSNGKFIMQARQTGSSVFSFTNANITLEPDGKSSFIRELVDRAPKPNRIRVFYSDEKNLNSETEAAADDDNDQLAREARIGNEGVNEEQLKVPAVSSQSQAERLAQMYLSESVESNWVYSWKTNVQGLPLQPGDLVDITHVRIPEGSKVLMVETIEQDGDDRIAIRATEYVPSAYS
jgi:cell wall-associated NlpC family hydrolase